MRAHVLAEGLHFGEGPRWHQGKLWFSDFFDHAVKTVDLDGKVETKVVIDDRPSGLGWLPDGRLLIVSMLHRRVLRMEYDALVVHAELGDIATFHCNDMLVDAHGRAYVGNFGFDLDAAVTGPDPAGALAAYQGAALARVDPNGTVHTAATALRFPNGMALTPDGGTLLVAESLGGCLTAFDVGVDGSLTNRRVWAQLDGAMPDGICLDAEGAVWLADARNPRCVRVREGGEVLDEVETSERAYACMLGGPDGRTLFALTAHSSLAERAAAVREGYVEAASVQVPHAGLP
jgi:sugar lactone lactonase YvrE